ncbi:cytochrome c oxidase subunit 6C-like [Coccinella septempunctata]|uniref:cytochrome c oxidase subunit 6C-like n=1 Tax=Coccinella septempunctata TaxID=41139 RepID=UPI001D070AB6|nr:cytochrome c oxidase subunit 6C-like [Coccinella septempunctata]
MTDATAKVYPRPQLKGLLKRQIGRNLIGLAIFTTTTVVAMKIFYNDKNKRDYAEFHKNYDIDKEFERMRKKGLFDSCSDED